ncbi:MAG: aminopeptidase, partial [Cytophaga sp.]|nr:aminopeptidase [Cytophaga sp.]
MSAQEIKKESPKWQGKFEQLDQLLPTPNEYRSSSGAPGPKYWQQRADYVINAELNDENQSITGSETITYFNNSPDALKYLWLQLDQNINEKGNNT